MCFDPFFWLMKNTLFEPYQWFNVLRNVFEKIKNKTPGWLSYLRSLTFIQKYIRKALGIWDSMFSNHQKQLNTDTVNFMGCCCFSDNAWSFFSKCATFFENLIKVDLKRMVFSKSVRHSAKVIFVFNIFSAEVFLLKTRFNKFPIIIHVLKPLIVLRENQIKAGNFKDNTTTMNG